MTVTINGTGPITGSDRAGQGANSDITALSNLASVNSGQLAGFRNRLINGNFDVWQRALSFASVNSASAGSSYTADRWQGFRFGGGVAGATFSRIIYAGNNEAGSIFAMRMQRDSGNTNTAGLVIATSLETAMDVWKLRGKQVTLSFWALAGANFSGGTVTANLFTGTGTDGSLYTGFTSQTSVAAVSGTATTFTKYTCTATLSTSVSQLGVYIGYTPTGTAGANDWVEISGVQLETGAVATPFEQRSVPLEKLLCLRYYNNVSDMMVSGYGNASQIIYSDFPFPVPMRVSPTSVQPTGISYNNASGYLINSTAADKYRVQLTLTATGYGNGYGGSGLNFSAELI